MINDITIRQRAIEWTPQLYTHWSTPQHYPCVFAGSAILPCTSAIQRSSGNISAALSALGNDEIIVASHRSDILENLSQHWTLGCAHAHLRRARPRSVTWPSSRHSGWGSCSAGALWRNAEWRSAERAQCRTTKCCKLNSTVCCA